MAALIFFVAFGRLVAALGRAVFLRLFREGREPLDLADLNLLLRAFIRVTYGLVSPDKRQFRVPSGYRRSFTQCLGIAPRGLTLRTHALLLRFHFIILRPGAAFGISKRFQDTAIQTAQNVSH
jgi:hypothetical protein